MQQVTREQMDVLVALDVARLERGQDWTNLEAFKPDALWELCELGLIRQHDAHYDLHQITDAGRVALVTGRIGEPLKPQRTRRGRPSVHKTVAEFLLRLAANPAHWYGTNTVADIPHHNRQAAIGKGWAEARGKTHERRYRITADGLAAVRDAGYELPTRAAAPAYAPAYENFLTLPDGHPLHFGDGHLPRPDPAPAPDGCSCANCAYRQAIAVLRETIPGVDEIVKGVLALNTVITAR
ncbi:MAG: hypothetical protein JNJ78_21780 [Anaerolineae bacterium]|nr:hypothetical protein [Anaerolineae bacterium]